MMFTVLRNTSEPALGKPEGEFRQEMTNAQRKDRLGSCYSDLVVPRQGLPR